LRHWDEHQAVQVDDALCRGGRSFEPLGAFGTAYLDPPWKTTGNRQPKFPLVATRDLPELIRGSGLFEFEENAHLYLSIVNYGEFFDDGRWLMRELGFRYVTNVAWAKDWAGHGRYFKGQHELVLFGVRGDGLKRCTPNRFVRSLVTSPRGKGHSGKPDAIYEKIEERSTGPFLEMFARRNRPGWIAWGNEVKEETHAAV
jgi:hypothetical protein